MSWESTVLELLSASLLRPFLLVAVAAVILRLFRVDHPASKHAVWTAVLIGMIVLPFVSVTVPHLEFQALPQGTLIRLDTLEPAESGPAFLPTTELSPAAAAIQQNAQQPARAAQPVSTTETSGTPAIPSTERRRLTSRHILLWGYLAGLIAFSVYRMVGWLLLQRLVSRSRPLMSETLRESKDVAIPLAVGVLRPRVILPSGWRDWSAPTRRAVLAHEFAHVRRRDPWVLALSRWVKLLLWFHPLSWWVSRRVTELAEMACDASAVERIGDPGKYSRILVDFAAVVNRHGYRATLPGLALFGRSRLSRRIDEVLAVSNGPRRRLARPAAVLAMIGLPSLGAAAALGLTEAASRPLQEVQNTVAAKIESLAEVTRTAGVVAAIAEVVPPALAPAEPVQTVTSPREFVDRYCLTCHTARASNGGLNLENQDLSQVNANARIWEKVVLKLRTGLKPIPDALPPRPTAAEVRGFVEWLEAELDRSAAPYTPAPGPHRLNRTEYGNAVHDVLGLDVNPALLLPPDDYSHGFDTIASTLGSGIRPELAAAYVAAADRLKDVALADPVSRQLLVCQSQDEPCARRIITRLATRAFRQQTTADEVNTLLAVHRRADYPDWGIKNVLLNVLTDPRFLVRTEADQPNVGTGQSYRIRDVELASRLSFFLWSRGPDEELIDLASRGQLSNPSVLEQQTRRMLKDPRSEALTLNFASQWLNVRGLAMVGPMPAYPEFDEPLRQAMQREAQLFFKSIVDEDRNVVDLLTADYTFLNERLARHYGVPNVSGEQFRRVTLLPAFEARRGVLGKAAFLTVTSRPDRTSLTQRGKWVLNTLLGIEPPYPPPNIPRMEPKVAPMRETMERELAVRPECSSCHLNMDPIGISLDNFDQAGKWRTQDQGMDINPVTQLMDGTKINGPADLRNALVSRSDQFVRTMTLKLLTYGLGRGTDVRDMPLVRSIARDAARDNNRFSAIVLGIVRSPAFQMNAKY